MIDAQTKQNIISNSLSVTVDDDQAIKIYDSRNELQGHLPAYYQNPSMLELNKKINKLRQGIDNTEENEDSVNRAMANPDFYPVMKNYTKDFNRIASAAAKEQYTRVTEEQEREWLGAQIAGNISTGYSIGKLGMEIGLLQDEARKTENEEQRKQLEGKIAAKEAELSQLNVDENSWAQSFGQVLGSMSETAPEMLAMSAGGALSSVPSPYTKIAGGSITALGTYGVYRKTSSAEAGSMYKQLQSYTNLTEQQKNELADSVGVLNGWIEVAGTSLGLGHLAKFTGKSAVGIAFKEKLNKAIVSTAIKKGAMDFAKKPTFIARFLKGLAGVTAETTSETLEEIMQNAISGGAEKQAQQAQPQTGIISTFLAGMENINTEEALKTFKTVAPGVGILSGGVRGTIGLAKGRINFKAPTADTPAQIAQDGQTNLEKAESIMQTKKESELYKKSPRAFNDITNAIVKDVDSHIYIDINDAIEMTEQAKTSEEMRKAVEALNLQARVEESQDGDGNVSIPFEEVSNIIFNPEDETLFQTVKDKISFDPTTLSKKQSDKLAKELLAETPQLESELQNKDLQITNLYESMRKGIPEDEAAAGAILLNQLANNMRTFRGEDVSVEDFLKEERLKIEAERRKTLDEKMTEANKPKRKLFGGKELHGKKIKTKDVPMEKIKGEDIIGGVGAEDMNPANVVLFEDKEGNYEVVSDNGTVANARINNAENLENPITVSEKDGYTVEDAKELAQDMEEVTYDEIYKPLRQIATDVATEIDNEFGSSSTSFMDIDILIKDDKYMPMDVAILNSLDDNMSPENMRQAYEDIRSNLEELGKRMFWEPGKAKDYAKLAYDEYVKRVSERWGRSSYPTLFQTSPSKDVIAGSYNAVQNLITLSQSSNPTTFAHEGAHWFTVSLFDDFDRGLLTDYWKKQAQTAAEWAGAKIIDGQITWKNDKAKVKGLEKLAEGFVTYLKEGKAPTPTLTKLYDYFRDLFTQTYRIIRGLPNIKLNPKIRDFFDRMVATEQEVNALREQERYGALAKPADMNQELYDRYLELSRAAHRDTVNSVVTQTAKIAEKKTTQEYKDVYNKLLEENINELMKEDEYQAIATAETTKINPASLEGVLPEGVKLNKKYLSETGLPADIIKNQGGFESVADLVNRLNENRNATQVATEVTERQMDDWLEQEFPDLLNSDPNLASRNINTIKLQVTEALMHKGIPTTESGLYFNRLVQNAEKAIGDMRMPQLTNIERLFKQLNTISERYRIAERKGDKNAMSTERWRAAVLNYMIMRGMQAKKLQSRFNRHYVKRYSKRPTTGQLKSIEGNVWDMMTAALNNFGYTGRKPANSQPLSGRINEYVAGLLEDNFDIADDLTDNSAFMDNLEGVNPRTITYNDFLIMSSEMDRLERRSKNVRQGILSENQQTIEEAAESIVKHFEKTGAKRWNDNDVIKNMTLGYSAMRESLLRRMFPRNVNLQYVSPVMEGIAKKTNWVNKTMKRFEKIMDPVISKGKQEYTINGKTFNYKTLLVMMLNSGTQHNRDSIIATLRDKRGVDLSETDYVDILRQAPKELRSISNQIWEVMSEDTPKMLRVVRRLNGQEVKLEDATPLDFNDGGENLNGGYYPAFKRTFDASIDVTNGAAHNLSKVLSMTGIVKERTKTPNNDLYLDYSALTNWVYQKGNLLHLAIPMDNMQNLLNNQTVRETIGEGAYRALTNGWLKYILTPDKVNRVIGELDSLCSAGILGGGVRKGIIQATGWITSLRFVNPLYMAESMFRVLSNPHTLWNLTDVARSKSNYMRGRFDNPAAYIADIRQYGELGAKTKSWVDKAKDLALWTVTRGDALSSVITWNAAYKQSLEQGMNERDASMQADSVVRMTQGDTSGGARPPMLQGNERFFTKFASYWVGVNSSLMSDLFYGTRKDKLFGATATIAFAGIMEPIISAFLQSVYTWLIASDEQKDKWKKDKKINNLEEYLKAEVEDNVKTSLASAFVPQFGLGFSLAKYSENEKLYGGEFLPLTFAITTGTLPIDGAKYLMADNEKDKDKIAKRTWKNAKKAVGWSNPIEFEALHDRLGKFTGGGK